MEESETVRRGSAEKYGFAEEDFLSALKQGARWGGGDAPHEVDRQSTGVSSQHHISADPAQPHSGTPGSSLQRLTPKKTPKPQPQGTFQNGVMCQPPPPRWGCWECHVTLPQPGVCHLCQPQGPEVWGSQLTQASTGPGWGLQVLLVLSARSLSCDLV